MRVPSADKVLRFNPRATPEMVELVRYELAKVGRYTRPAPFDRAIVDEAPKDKAVWKYEGLCSCHVPAQSPLFDSSGVVVPMIEPLPFVARNWLVMPVMAKLVVEALVKVVLPRIVVAPVLEPMVERPERVDTFGKDVVAFNLVSNLDVV